MKIFITAKPGSKVSKVERTDDGRYIVRVKERARDGKANQAVVKLLANYFQISRSSLQIVRGLRAKKKVIVISKKL